MLIFTHPILPYISYEANVIVRESYKYYAIVNTALCLGDDNSARSEWMAKMSIA